MTPPTGRRKVAAFITISTMALGIAGQVPSATAAPASSTSTTRTVTEPAPSRTPVVAFIGDSYTAGAGGDGTRWTTELSQRMGWAEANHATGATGWIAEPSPEVAPLACGLPNCANFVEQGQTVVRSNPDIVVINGGRNDTTAEVGAAATKLFTTLRAGLPNAQIFVIKPLYDAAPYPSQLSTLANRVQSAAATAGVAYIDIANPLEGHPEWISSDRVHPNADGHRAVAKAFAAQWPTLALTASSTSPAKGSVRATVALSQTRGAWYRDSWQLLGPVKKVKGGCTQAKWTGAPVAQKGTLTMKGDTSQVLSLKVAKSGCYAVQHQVAVNPATPAMVIAPVSTDGVLVK